MNNSIDRRKFLFQASATGVAVLAAQLIPMGMVSAADLPAVDPAGPQATALGYVTDASTTDTAKFARYKAGQTCANCQLYQGTADASMGPCLLFAGQAVAAGGWCNSWVQKPG
ncbi:MAG: high-potential iron-sulfur protein [Proteobacteria bacterium]|nr:high-potential iron-sulfur protein [Pseudomonadota bacterium]